MKNIYRIDDVSINTNEERLSDFISLIRENDPQSSILLAVSLGVFKSPTSATIQEERIFPSILNAFSDHRLFFEIDDLRVPDWLKNFSEMPWVSIASHGLVHVDHRLLPKPAQELSVMVTCSVLGSRVFVPPFNKWNSDLEEVCSEHEVELIVWEEGWIHLKYQSLKTGTGHKYYFHTHDFEVDFLRSRFEGARE